MSEERFNLILISIWTLVCFLYCMVTIYEAHWWKQGKIKQDQQAVALLVFTVPFGSCQRWHSETIDLLKMNSWPEPSDSGEQSIPWKYEMIKKQRHAPALSKGKKEREKGSKGRRRGKKRTIQYINVNGMYTVFLCFQLRGRISHSWKCCTK